MKNIIKWLFYSSIKLSRKCDNYLIHNYPTIWRTRIHIVLPLAIITYPLLFAAGYYLPRNTFLNPIVHPIQPVEITDGSFFLFPFTFAIVAMLYWGYTQYVYKFEGSQPRKIILTLIIYAIGLFVIIALDTTAFKLGTITKSSLLVSKKDLKYIKHNDSFSYGFFPPPKDISYEQHKEYFSKNTIFKTIKGHEDYILYNRYKREYWLSLSDLSLHLYYSNSPNLFDLKQNRGSAHINPSFLFNANQPESADLNKYSKSPFFNHLLGNVDENTKLLLLHQLNRIDLSKNPNEFLNIPSIEYWSSLTYNVEGIDQSDLANLSYLFYMLKDSVASYNLDDYQQWEKAYFKYYINSIFNSINVPILEKYGLNVSMLPVKTKNISLKKPNFLILLEEGVRSVEHAKQYLEQKIIVRYYVSVAQYLPILLLLFFGIPLLLQKNSWRTFLIFLLALAICSFFVLIGNYIYGETQQIIAQKSSNVYIENSSEAMMPFGIHKEKFLANLGLRLMLFSLIINFISIFTKDVRGLANLFIHVFIVSAIFTVFVPIFITNSEAQRFNEDGLYYIKSIKFYLASILCIIAPLLFCHVYIFPKINYRSFLLSTSSYKYFARFRLNNYLLRRYPTVWRFKIHILIPVYLCISLLLFILGYYLPKNTFSSPLIDPIQPIELLAGKYSNISFLLMTLISMYWTYQLYLYKSTKFSFKKIFLGILLYSGGLLAALGISTVSFQMGIIVKTANLIDNDDLKYFEDNKCFLYGFFPHKSSSKTIEKNYFEADTIFQKLWESEQYILENRYNKTYWSFINANNINDLSIKDRSYLSYLSFKYDISDRYRKPDKYNLNIPIKLNYLSDKDDLLFLSYLSTFPDRQNKSYLYKLDSLKSLNRSSSARARGEIEHLSYTLYRDKNYSAFREIIRLGEKFDENISNRYLNDICNYENYYEKNIFARIDTTRLNKYGLGISMKEIQQGDMSFNTPEFTYQLEDSIRSVKNARQYLEQNIFSHYLKMLLLYIPFVVLTFYILSLRSIKVNLFWSALVLCLVIILVANLIYGEVQQNMHKEMPWGMHKEFFLPYWTMCTSILSFAIILISTLLNRFLHFNTFFIYLFLFSSISTVITPIFIENINAQWLNQDYFYYPKTWVFYLTLVLAILAPALFSYLSVLPKNKL